MCNFKDKLILATGGMYNRATVSDVSAFDLEKKEWMFAPFLNFSRSGHSSCVLGHSIYVFCGVHFSNLATNTIEKLEPTSMDLSKRSRWTLINVPKTELTPRYWPVAVPLNTTQIVIMGGKNDQDESLASVAIFDTKTDTCEKFHTKGDEAYFSTSCNEAYQLRENHVVALVEDSEKYVHMVEFSKSDRKVFQSVDSEISIAELFFDWDLR